MTLRIIRMNQNWNKVSTKEELKENLKDLEEILNNKTIDYLDSLIELDYSVISPNITEKERLILSQLELYRKITIYNIYKRAINIFKNNNLEIKGNNNGIEGLRVYYKKDYNIIDLFDFDYSKNTIGDICLYKTTFDNKYREKALEDVMKKLEQLYDEKNPYHDAPNSFGGPESRWNFDHKMQINEYEELFKNLDRKEITDEEKQKEEITQKYYDILMKDYHLTEDDLDEQRPTFKGEQIEKRKILVKRLPGIKITNIITYL